MALQAQSFALLMLLVLLPITIEGNSTPKEVQENSTSSTSLSSSSSPLMKEGDNQITGCAGSTMLCNQGVFPPRYICCGDRCVDVTSDSNNCGFCGLTCPDTRQCCRGLCRNTYLSLFNCGGCGRVCPIGSLCIYGVCYPLQAGLVQRSPSGPSPLYPPLTPEEKSPQPLEDQPQYHYQPPEMD